MTDQSTIVDQSGEGPPRTPATLPPLANNNNERSNSSDDNHNNTNNSAADAWKVPQPLSQSGSQIALPMLFASCSKSGNRSGSNSRGMALAKAATCINSSPGDHLLGNRLINASASLSPNEQRKAPQRWKEVAFFQEINKFYSRYHHQSWKNVLSIGDSVFERDAVRKVAQMRPSPDKQCRTKTLKMYDDPDITELILQVKIVHEILAMAVQFDGPLDIVIDNQDLQDAAAEAAAKR
eukprot:CAMPEP_0206525372 /NCGR_PEP_ID=MMETSP0324_2-20121206/68696_1 /ASSEMBLY_ACC=CAM_ASM_000836 /TAXON_ID=2866 /ORGANISM="Crypthecodinium cohnii, Strain Seligo" /LENGTH=236 /DNA_ID=CAMNT_0054020029 /DNA_START=27 /DNA_END=737 /DNA_ORIENTATION=+